MIDNEALEGAAVDNDISWSSSLGSRSKSSGYGTVSSTVSRHRRPRMKTSNSKMNFGEATDDVHVCIMCLRAIMNHQVALCFAAIIDLFCLFIHIIIFTFVFIYKLTFFTLFIFPFLFYDQLLFFIYLFSLEF